MTRPDRTRRLGYAERWLHDGLLVSHQPAFHQSIEVDVSRVNAGLTIARERGIRLTYTHVLVRATALALSTHPKIHQVLAGNRMQEPSGVDIALSVSGKGSVVPTLVIRNADEKPIDVIANEIVRRLPEVREDHRKLLSALDSWGWLVPFGPVRRALLRLLFRSFRFRRNGAGTFQVSLVSSVDQCASPLFNAAGILVGSQVRDRVVAVDGLPSVRPTIVLTCSADHRVWNGQDCQQFLLAVRDILIGSEFEREILKVPARRQVLENVGPAGDALRNY
jgi:pyruvate/2-oxoglutarate dehydrogenase complex dihydrolipoamide acyltransferase (E2) component